VASKFRVEPQDLEPDGEEFCNDFLLWSQQIQMVVTDQSARIIVNGEGTSGTTERLSLSVGPPGAQHSPRQQSDDTCTACLVHMMLQGTFPPEEVIDAIHRVQEQMARPKMLDKLLEAVAANLADRTDNFDRLASFSMFRRIWCTIGECKAFEVKTGLCGQDFFWVVATQVRHECVAMYVFGTLPPRAPSFLTESNAENRASFALECRMCNADVDGKCF
jgi:hypothetical protein